MIYKTWNFIKRNLKQHRGTEIQRARGKLNEGYIEVLKQHRGTEIQRAQGKLKQGHLMSFKVTQRNRETEDT